MAAQGGLLEEATTCHVLLRARSHRAAWPSGPWLPHSLPPPPHGPAMPLGTFCAPFATCSVLLSKESRKTPREMFDREQRGGRGERAWWCGWVGKLVGEGPCSTQLWTRVAARPWAATCSGKLASLPPRDALHPTCLCAHRQAPPRGATSITGARTGAHVVLLLMMLLLLLAGPTGLGAAC